MNEKNAKKILPKLGITWVFFPNKPANFVNEKTIISQKINLTDFIDLTVFNKSLESWFMALKSKKMANFKLSLQKTLTHEGGYANNTNDTGGETYKGISRKFHPAWSGWIIIDIYKHSCNFPKSLDQDTELQQKVEDFYHVNFWQPLKADQIENQSMADSIFDFAVNAGTKTSVRYAQSIIGVGVDGIIGSQTLAKLNSYNPEYFHTTFSLEKIKHYINSIKNRPTNKTYLYGWTLRTLYYS